MNAKRKIVNVKREDLVMPGSFDSAGRQELIDVKAGSLVILVENEFVGPSNYRTRSGKVCYSFVDYATHPDGIGGNMDPSKKALEGWRGTTDDWSTTALGVWRVVEICDSRFWDERPDPRYGFCGTKLARVVLEQVVDKSMA